MREGTCSSAVRISSWSSSRALASAAASSTCAISASAPPVKAERSRIVVSSSIDEAYRILSDTVCARISASFVFWYSSVVRRPSASALAAAETSRSSRESASIAFSRSRMPDISSVSRPACACHTRARVRRMHVCVHARGACSSVPCTCLLRLGAQRLLRVGDRLLVALLHALEGILRRRLGGSRLAHLRLEGGDARLRVRQLAGDLQGAMGGVRPRGDKRGEATG